jgi:hypothetical protein
MSLLGILIVVIIVILFNQVPMTYKKKRKKGLIERLTDWL